MLFYEKAEKINIKLVLAVGSGCLVGVMAYVSVSYGFSAISTKGVVFCISFAVGAFLMLVANKSRKGKMAHRLYYDDQHACGNGGSLCYF